jgi:hypothetical protein
MTVPRRCAVLRANPTVVLMVMGLAAAVIEEVRLPVTSRSTQSVR